MCARACLRSSPSGSHSSRGAEAPGNFRGLGSFPSRIFFRRGISMAKVTKLKPREGRAMAAALDTPTDISAQAVKELSKALNGLLADPFALYLKTKNFHWHVSGPH